MVQQTQQPYCFGDNDPVNVGDPSGTASLSPASATSYDYSFDLGPLGTPDQVAGFTRFECPVVFLPLRGCTSEFQLGERLNLHESFLWFTQSFPVRVIALSSTSWTFIALPGHPEDPVAPSPSVSVTEPIRGTSFSTFTPHQRGARLLSGGVCVASISGLQT